MADDKQSSSPISPASSCDLTELSLRSWINSSHDSINSIFEQENRDEDLNELLILTEEDITRVKNGFRISHSEEFHDAFRCRLYAHPKDQQITQEVGTLCIFTSIAVFYKVLPMGAPTVFREGYLEKRSEKGNRLSTLFKGHSSFWHTYYFTLDQNKIVYYLNESNKDKYTTNGIIPIEDIHSVVIASEVETKKEFCFQVLTSNRLYCFACKSEYERSMWMEDIKMAMAKKSPETRANVMLSIPYSSITTVHKLSTIIYPYGININSATSQFIICFSKENRRKALEILSKLWSPVTPTLVPTARSYDSILSRLSPNVFKRSDPVSPMPVHTPKPLYAKEAPETVEFRARFNLPDTEDVIASFLCGMLRSVLVHGKMYISYHYICFYSSHLGVTRKVVIPFQDVIQIEKHHFQDHWLFKSIYIKTNTTEFVFCDFLHREEAIKYLNYYHNKVKSESMKANLTISFNEENYSELSDIPTGLNVTILIVGSRGDVQPFIALALGLEKVGHHVTIATHEAHREFVTGYNIKFFPLAGDPRKLMKLCVDNGMFSISFMKEAYKSYMEFIDQLLVTSWEATKHGTDVIIQNPPSMVGHHIAEKLGIPVFTAFTMPWSRTTVFPHPFAVPKVPMGPFYNYTSYIAVDQGMWVPLAAKFNKFRERLGLPALDIRTGGALVHDRQIPHMYCWSATVLPKPPDWPEYISVTGYWFLESPQTWKPPQDLLDFMAKEPKPIYIGFGSVTVSDPDGLTQIIVDALVKSGQRAILVKGWGGLGNVKFPPNVYCSDGVPHDWIFPQLAGVVHHGGAGTTAAGLRAGVPTFIVPFFGDQFFWGNRVMEMGVGVAPITVKKLTVNNLAAALTKLTSDEKMREKAADLGKHIREQDGVARAVDFFHKQLRRFPMQPEKVQENKEEITVENLKL